MKRYDCEKHTDVEEPNVDAFLDDLIAVCRKHGMSLGHEDHHGAFVVYRQVHPRALDWLSAAHVDNRFLGF